MKKHISPSAMALASLGLLIPAGGCSSSVQHPSLAPRSVERFEVAPPSEAPAEPVAVPADASRQERIAALLKQAQDGDQRFQAQLAQASDAVVRGAGASVGGENWVEAQQGVSRIDALRSPVTQALADLDALQLEAASSPIGTAAASSLAAAVATVSEIDERERAAVAALQGRLAQP